MVTEDGDYVRAKVWGFIPKDRKEIKIAKEKVDYNKMIKQKVCYECGDEIIDYSYVEAFIMALEETMGVIIEQIGYDRWNAISSIQKLEAAGYEVVEVKQHSSVLHMPTKWLYELILKRLFQYEENKMLEINFQNARCTEDTNKNKFVNKKKSAGKIDEVIAIIIALYLLQQYVLFGTDDFIVQT